MSPLYDRICAECNWVLKDNHERMNDDNIKMPCPKCGQQMHRMMPLVQPPQGGDTPHHHRRGK